MKRITIIFKSGSTTSFLANSFSIKRSFGTISDFSWNCEGMGKYPLHLEPDSIDAVIVEEIAE